MLLWTTTDKWPLITLLAFAPRWLCGLPLLVLIPLSLVFYRHALIPLGLALTTVAGPIMGFGCPGPMSLVARGPSLRVLTWNVNGRKGSLAKLSDAIPQISPDIVALQECHGQSIENVWPENWHVRQIDTLVLGARYPIRVERVDHVDYPRRTVHFVVSTPDRDVRLTVLHLPSVKDGIVQSLGSARAESHADALRENIRFRRSASKDAAGDVTQNAGPFLVVGDFNMTTDSAVYRDFWSAYSNAFSRAGFGYGYSKITSFAGWTYGTRIDHILMSPGWKCRRCWVGPAMNSDHRPVIADLILTAPPENTDLPKVSLDVPCAPSVIAIDPGGFDSLRALLLPKPHVVNSPSLSDSHDSPDDGDSHAEGMTSNASVPEDPALDVSCRYVTLDIDGWYKMPVNRPESDLPTKMGLGRVRLTQDDCNNLVPANAKRNECFKMSPSLADKFLRHALVDRTREPATPWNAEDLRCYRMTLTVENQDEQFVHLRLDGEAMLATSPDPALAETGYEVRLLGYLTLSRPEKTLTRFDVVAAGDAWTDGARHRGVAPDRPLLAVAMELSAPDVAGEPR